MGSVLKKLAIRMRKTLRLTEETKDGLLVLSPRGRLDDNSSTSFEQAMKAHALRPHGTTRVVMNCAGLTYVSATGMCVLLTLAECLAGTTSALVVCELKGHVAESLTISGLSQVLTTADTERDALKQF